MAKITLQSIWRYPVKGLQGQSLPEADLSVGAGLAYDRAYGFAVAGGKVTPLNRAWAPKKNFLNLAVNDKLAQLNSEFDPATTKLTLYRKGKKFSSGDLSQDMGRMLIESSISAFLGAEVRAGLKLVPAPDDQPYYDVAGGKLSLINLNSIKDLETRVIQQAVDPQRFRANLWVEGMPAFHELSLQAGQKFTIGEAVFEVQGPIERCRATCINPESGAEDMNIPLSLQRAYGHRHFGIYVAVITPGKLAQGQPFALINK